MKKPEDIVKKIIGKGRYTKSDRDGDGVKNSKDCQPDNPMRQDAVDIAGRGLQGLNNNMRRYHGSSYFRKPKQ